MAERLSWEEYGLLLAFAAASRSEDTRKVGAIVLRKDNTIASAGYNGMPSGVDYVDGPDRHSYIIHAEINALRWTTPAEISGGLLCVTHHPCGNCLKEIAAYGLKRIVWTREPGEKHDLMALAYVAKVLSINLRRVQWVE